MANTSGVTVTCYGEKKHWQDREDAFKFYYDGVCCCEGSERDRYMNICIGIMEGLEEVTDED